MLLPIRVSESSLYCVRLSQLTAELSFERAWPQVGRWTIALPYVLKAHLTELTDLNAQLRVNTSPITTTVCHSHHVLPKLLGVLKLFCKLTSASLPQMEAAITFRA